MTATFYVGDVLDVLGKLPENSVDLVLTSPPFLALRSYLPADHPDKEKEGGSQSTPGEYIDWLLDVVEACDRVLAPHGSLCFELGDTYAGSGGAGGDYAENGLRDGQPKFRQVASREHRPEREGTGADGGARFVPPNGGRGWPLPKSLSLIPESFRFAMVYGFNPFTGRQTERWRLRNVIRWVRPNPPVGALGDKFRPATSELMVFCKSAKRYFDLDAVREPAQQPLPAGNTKDLYNPGINNKDGSGRYGAHPAGSPPLDWWNIPPGGYSGAHYAVWPEELLIKPIKAMCPEFVCRTCGEARRRIVNTREGFARQPQLAAHIRAQREALRITHDEINGWFGFKEIAKNWERTDPYGAAIPSAEVWPVLKERLYLSGEEFDDLVLGERRWTESLAEYVPHGDPIRHNSEPKARADYDLQQRTENAQGMTHGRATKVSKDAGFTDCGHDDYRPGLVLDPFVGSGTTLAVATGHGRDAIGVDLDERNYDLALERVGPLVLQRGELAA